MLIGYVLYGYENDSYMYSEAVDMPVCDKCGYKIDYDYVNPHFIVKRKVYDFSNTYDNCCIVSLKFKEFCRRENYKGLNFIEIPLSPQHFLMKVSNILDTDTSNNETLYENLCESCGSFESVSLPRPIIIKNINEPLIDGFYSLDKYFGSGNEKNQVIVAGIETVKKIKREKLKGIFAEKLVVEKKPVVACRSPK